MLDYLGAAPDALLEKLAVISAMGAVTQRLDEMVYREVLADAESQYHRAEIAVDVFGNLLFDGREKICSFWESYRW